MQIHFLRLKDSNGVGCQEDTHLGRAESACEMDELVDKVIGTERGVSYTLTASLGLTDNIISVHTPALGG